MQYKVLLVLLVSFIGSAQVQASSSLPALVTCKNAKGEAAPFNTEHCHKAAAKLAEGKVSSAKCGTCALALVDPTTKAAFTFSKAVDVNAVRSGVDTILAACVNPAHHKRAETAVPNKNAPVVILGKGDGGAC